MNNFNSDHATINFIKAHMPVFTRLERNLSPHQVDFKFIEASVLSFLANERVRLTIDVGYIEGQVSGNWNLAMMLGLKYNSS